MPSSYNDYSMTSIHFSSTPFDTLHTLRDWLRWSVSRFREANIYFGHGTTSAYDEAVYLLLHTLHLPLDQLEPFLDARLTANEQQAVYNIIKTRVETRKPAAYLTNESWLGSFRFYVDERTIVPRSLIAYMLMDEEASFIHPWIEAMNDDDEPSMPSRVLDLCTGSGCLAIILAHAFPDAHVDAVDLSTDALAVAQRNVVDYELTSRISLHHSDLFTALPANQRYDVIISNPPYVTTDSVNRLPAEYKHEPAMALGAGEKGLDCITPMLKEAHRYLEAHGILIVEVGHNKEIIEDAFPELPFIWFEAPENEGHVFLITAADIQPDVFLR